MHLPFPPPGQPWKSDAQLRSRASAELRDYLDTCPPWLQKKRLTCGSKVRVDLGRFFCDQGAV